MKGLPLAYNRDLQEDKEALFDAVDTLQTSLEVFTGMVRRPALSRRGWLAHCTGLHPGHGLSRLPGAQGPDLPLRRTGWWAGW